MKILWDRAKRGTQTKITWKSDIEVAKCDREIESMNWVWMRERERERAGWAAYLDIRCFPGLLYTSRCV